MLLVIDFFNSFYVHCNEMGHEWWINMPYDLCKMPPIPENSSYFRITSKKRFILTHRQNIQVIWIICRFSEQAKNFEANSSNWKDSDFSPYSSLPDFRFGNSSKKRQDFSNMFLLNLFEKLSNLDANENHCFIW